MGCHTLIVVNCTYLMTQNELSSALLFFYSATRFMTVFCKPNRSGACFAWCSTCCTSYHCLQRPCLLTSLIPTKFHQAYSCHLSFRFCLSGMLLSSMLDSTFVEMVLAIVALSSNTLFIRVPAFLGDFLFSKYSFLSLFYQCLQGHEFQVLVVHR